MTAGLVARTRAFIRDVVIPAEPAWGETLAAEALAGLRAAAREAGVYAPHAPAAYGGLGLALPDWSPVFQEAGYSPIGPAVLNCMAPDEGNMRLLELVATDEQKERYLRPLVAGEIRSSFAMTEPHPGAGSDPAALATTARRVDGGWVIDGEKRFISGAEGAMFAIVMARTDAGDGHPAGATMLLTPLDADGVRIGPSIRTIEAAIAGGHPHVRFAGVFVPDADVLGAPGEGFRYAQVRLGPARLTHCMRWLGLARRAFDISLDRANARELFGARLADLGVAQALIADSAIDLATADAVIDAAARALEDDPRRGADLSAIAKVHCSEAVYRVIDRAVQLCGGDGVSSGLPLIQYLNEVRPFRIYDGSSETHRWAIARRAAKDRAREVAAGEPRRDVVDGGAR
ncbi:acyl-CoA dehydrogenase family protein [Microbacterium saccharophilum]|uniref:Acyl-CoA dehydrogenase family protein n=1 Tax=Microbacterium saccharophilum TaxID=1213358 RepID=A0A5C8I8B5_9MICO|nr:acyl-CoA dehydrogenase family protein [Microbacterium saccharophilum]TXK14899.1 acyl-CoA dehydrogenase family protein [Microbacterium saccharophilum]GEP47289.1 acyl-CoA dehydrogenase [Microbacterium saccharophilum]